MFSRARLIASRRCYCRISPPPPTRAKPSEIPLPDWGAKCRVHPCTSRIHVKDAPPKIALRVRYLGAFKTKKTHTHVLDAPQLLTLNFGGTKVRLIHGWIRYIFVMQQAALWMVWGVVQGSTECRATVRGMCMEMSGIPMAPEDVCEI